MWQFQPSRNSIPYRPISQKHPYLDPVQKAPEHRALEYGNSSSAEILFSTDLYPRRRLTGIPYNRPRNVEFWNIGIPAQRGLLYSTDLHSKRLLTGIPYKRLRNIGLWNMRIPAQQKFDIPQTYIPEASLREPMTNGSGI